MINSDTLFDDESVSFGRLVDLYCRLKRVCNREFKYSDLSLETYAYGLSRLAICNSINFLASAKTGFESNSIAELELKLDITGF